MSGFFVIFTYNIKIMENNYLKSILKHLKFYTSLIILSLFSSIIGVLIYCNINEMITGLIGIFLFIILIIIYGSMWSKKYKNEKIN